MFNSNLSIFNKLNYLSTYDPVVYSIPLYSAVVVKMVVRGVLGLLVAFFEIKLLVVWGGSSDSFGFDGPLARSIEVELLPRLLCWLLGMEMVDSWVVIRSMTFSKKLSIN